MRTPGRLRGDRPLKPGSQSSRKRSRRAPLCSRRNEFSSWGRPRRSLWHRSLRKTLVNIDRLLDGIGTVERRGPHVIIVFDNRGRYYDYVDYFHTEDREYGGSAGMFFRHGYPHIVVGPGEPWSRRSTIAHELTHDYLSGRELPLWLDEGLAQQQQRHKARSSVSGLRPFWSGEAFSMPDESQELAYQLALIVGSQHHQRCSKTGRGVCARSSLPQCRRVGRPARARPQPC